MKALYLGYAVAYPAYPLLTPVIFSDRRLQGLFILILSLDVTTSCRVVCAARKGTRRLFKFRPTCGGVRRARGPSTPTITSPLYTFGWKISRVPWHVYTRWWQLLHIAIDIITWRYSRKRYLRAKFCRDLCGISTNTPIEQLARQIYLNNSVRTLNIRLKKTHHFIFLPRKPRRLLFR
jgi:hypothetical protein